MSYVATHGWGRIYHEEVATTHVTASQPPVASTTANGSTPLLRDTAGASEDLQKTPSVRRMFRISRMFRIGRMFRMSRMFWISRLFRISSLISSSRNTCHVIGIASSTMTAWRQFGSMGSHDPRLINTAPANQGSPGPGSSPRTGPTLQPLCTTSDKVLRRRILKIVRSE